MTHAGYLRACVLSFVVVSAVLYVRALPDATSNVATTPDPNNQATQLNSVPQPGAGSEHDAIQWLHDYVDDDNDGYVDAAESADFVSSELLLNGSPFSATTERQNSFHGNDSHVSPEELWQFWNLSPVRNWSTDDVVNWLNNVVELPQYETAFRQHEIRGTSLPLIAANVNHFMSNVLLPQASSIDRRKIMLKAQDAVLFGPPPTSHAGRLLILLTVLLVLLVTTGSMFFMHYRKQSKKAIDKLKARLDHLTEAEATLRSLQTRLDESRSGSLAPPSLEMSPRHRDSMSISRLETPRRNTERQISTDEKLQRLEEAEEEVQRLQTALLQLEQDVETSKRIHDVTSLENLLVVSCRVESRWLDWRLIDAQKRLLSARDACERIGKKHNSVFGLLRVTQNSLSEVDRAVLEARMALSGVHTDLEEHGKRWAEIERITSFNIVAKTGHRSPIREESSDEQEGSSIQLSMRPGRNENRQDSIDSAMTSSRVSSASSDFSKKPTPPDARKPNRTVITPNVISTERQSVDQPSYKKSATTPILTVSLESTTGSRQTLVPSDQQRVGEHQTDDNNRGVRKRGVNGASPSSPNLNGSM